LLRFGHALSVGHKEAESRVEKDSDQDKNNAHDCPDIDLVAITDPFAHSVISYRGDASRKKDRIHQFHSFIVA
jgi:hypothetical protein